MIRSVWTRSWCDGGFGLDFGLRLWPRAGIELAGVTNINDKL